MIALVRVNQMGKSARQRRERKDHVRYVSSRPMLKSFQLFCESRGAIASLVAILLASAILFAFLLPIPACGIDHVTFSFPVLFFCLVIPAETKSDWVLLGSVFSTSEPFLAASYGRAPPA